MTQPSLAERIVNTIAERTQRFRTSRRSFLGGAALVGAAMAVDPFGYLTRPASAYDAVCGSDNTCAAGYTVFCCTINGGSNTCPPDSFIGGWWKADNSSFCGGNARYYIDCNAYRDGRYTCHCNTTTCDQRRVACNQFRYGQCNTQIPWSNTGPVLCRVVSCTPPWVQYGGTCSSSSATDNNTATHSAPCLTGRLPVGVVDEISCSGNTVHVKGWAYDPDSPSTSLTVAIYEDGHGVMGIHASLPRPDVNAARHISGNHGFEVRFEAGTGRHTFTVFALNIGSGSSNPQIGGRTIIVNPGSAPIGHLDQCSSSGGTVTLAGWALDRDRPTTAPAVNIYQDGKPLMGIHCGLNRPDVNAAYHVSGLHGFSVQFRAAAGAHNYKLYAINLGGGSGNTLIGNRSLVVRSSAAAPADYRDEPLPGQVDSVTATGSQVRLVGWAQDQRRRDVPATVVVVAEDGALHWFTADLPRPELAESHGVTGPAGFDITIPAGTGVHTYAVHLLADAAAAEPEFAPMLGRHTVRVGQRGAIGRLEQVTELGDIVRLAGWAYDPDQPSEQVPLIVFRDGAAITAERVDRAPTHRAGLDGALGEAGFDITVANLPGTHSYTVYAASPVPGGKPSMLGGVTLPGETAQPAAPAGVLL